jgi:hypothetical protein
MSELDEREQRQSEQLQRRVDRMNKKDVPLKEQYAAADHLKQLLDDWNKGTDCSNRTFNAVKKEAQRLLGEIYDGKIEHLDERFAQAVESAVARSLPKKRITYLKLSHALQELVQLNMQWSQVAPRSKTEQEQMLRKLRVLLLEIEAGHTEDLAERFRLATEMTNSPEYKQE